MHCRLFENLSLWCNTFIGCLKLIKGKKENSCHLSPRHQKHGYSLYLIDVINCVACLVFQDGYSIVRPKEILFFFILKISYMACKKRNLEGKKARIAPVLAICKKDYLHNGKSLTSTSTFFTYLNQTPLSHAEFLMRIKMESRSRIKPTNKQFRRKSGQFSPSCKHNKLSHTPDSWRIQ